MQAWLGGDPFADLADKQVSVDVKSVVRASADSFRVAWDERRYDHGQLAGTTHWSAILIRESAGRSVETAGDKIVSRQLDVQPTITVRPGARVRVLVSRDLLLTPWPPR